MKLYFNDQNQLIFDGYDAGETVKKLRGNYDYEYYYTLEPQAIRKLYALVNIPVGERKKLLENLKESFAGNEAYSNFGKFLRDNDIAYTSFHWD